MRLQNLFFPFFIFYFVLIFQSSEVGILFGSGFLFFFRLYITAVMK